MTDDQAKLLKMAEDGVAAAELLLDNGFPGFAASRAYYAMFALAQAYLLGQVLSFSRHSAVIAAFGRHFAKTSIVPADQHRHLIAAQQDRQSTDYGSDIPVSRTEAALYVEHARDFLRYAQTNRA